MKRSDEKVIFRNGTLVLLMLGAMIFMTVRYAPLLSYPEYWATATGSGNMCWDTINGEPWFLS